MARRRIKQDQCAALQRADAMRQEAQRIIDQIYRETGVRPGECWGWSARLEQKDEQLQRQADMHQEQAQSLLEALQTQTNLRARVTELEGKISDYVAAVARMEGRESVEEEVRAYDALKKALERPAVLQARNRETGDEPCG